MSFKCDISTDGAIQTRTGRGFNNILADVVTDHHVKSIDLKHPDAVVGSGMPK